MEMEKVKELITAFKEAELTSLSLKCEAFELKLGKEVKVQEAVYGVNPVSYQAVASSPRDQVTVPQEVAVTVVPETKKSIKSPIVGTFYRAGSPQGEPFVSVGSKVKKGDVVCVIEAMKLMNEVEAEQDGEVIEILVENEEMVEYGQPLFVLR